MARGEKRSGNCWIKRLERLEGILNNQDKTDIVLVWCGFKPAAMVEISYAPRPSFSRKEFQKTVQALERILNGLRLVHALRVNYPKHQKEITGYSYITRDKKTLEKIIVADTLKSAKDRRLRVGLLLGYPKTAVRAFAERESVKLKDLPETILRRKEMKFLNFRLSHHWRTELAYLKKRAELVKRYAPELYQGMVS